MKPTVLFIVPPKTRRPMSGYISPLVDASVPLGILQMASFLEKNNYTVKLIDNLGDKESVSHKSNKEEIMYGIPKARLKQRIKESNANIVGISGQFNAHLDMVLYIAKIVKEVNPKMPIVVGGAVINDEIVKILKDKPEIDLCVYGEGENTILDLAKWCEGNIKLEDVDGIAYKKDGKVIKNKPRQWNFKLDELPFPAYHLVDMDWYLELPKKGIHYRIKDDYRTMTMITSRGCPENCNFCAIHLVSGKAWRAFSPEYVVDHMQLLVEKYGVEQIHIEDDNFTLDMKRAEKICDLIIERGLNVRWDTPNGVRADKLSERLIIKLKKAGCWRLTVAPEVGNQEVLDKIIDKKMDLKKVEDAARLCQKHGMPLVAFFVLGFPGETKTNLQETVDFAKRLMRKYNVIVGGAMHATPFYGTRLWKEVTEKGYLTKEVTPEALGQSLSGKAGLIKTNEFTPEEVQRYNQKIIRASFFYSAIRYLKQPWRIPYRFRNFYLVKSTLMRFVKGVDV